MVVRKSIQDAGKESNQITMKEQTLTRATDAHESSNRSVNKWRATIQALYRRKEGNRCPSRERACSIYYKYADPDTSPATTRKGKSLNTDTLSIEERKYFNADGTFES